MAEIQRMGTALRKQYPSNSEDRSESSPSSSEHRHSEKSDSIPNSTTSSGSSPDDDDFRGPVVVEWDSYLRALGVPPRLVDCGMQPLRGEPYFEAVLKAGGSAAPWPTVVYLFGKNGNGKTHMATWLFATWHARQMRGFHDARERGLTGIGTRIFAPRALWRTERTLTESLKAYSEESFDLRRVMAEYLQPDILLADDVFTEKTSDTDISNVTDILEARRNLGRITIITSNKTPIMISDQYSQRLAERLIDDALAVEFTGPSHRMAKYFKSAMEQ